MSNHFARNIITRGNMNISALTRGFILPKFEFIIKKKKGGGSPGTGIGMLQKELEHLQKDEIDVIEVYVDWDKSVDKYGKKVYAKLIEKKITAELLNRTNENYKISVNLVDKK